MQDIEIQIARTYYKTGTNGKLFVNGVFLCYSIELPWKANQNRVSCIPEGSYPLSLYNSSKHGLVLLVNNVPHRDMVEVHSANFATGKDGKHPELLGCIAPVTTLEPDKPGVGWASRQALAKLNGIVFPTLKAGHRAVLVVRSDNGYPVEVVA